MALDRRNAIARSGIVSCMADYQDLTDLQLMILTALWNRKEATVSELHEELRRRAPVSRKTVATLLARLERRGMVRHRMSGRDGMYRAVAGRRGVVLSRMSAMLGAMFGSPEPAPGAHAVDPSDVRSGDVRRLLALLRRAERDLKDLE